MAENNSRQGGTESFKQGILKRPLPWVTVCYLGDFEDGVLTERTAKCRLHGLSPNFNVIVSAGIILAGANSLPLYPPLPGTFKVTPFQKSADGEMLFLKSLTLAPAILPASYSLGPGLLIGATADNPDYGTNVADGAVMEVAIDPAQYEAQGALAGRVVIAVTATYNGNWWDVETISQMIGKLTIDAPAPFKVNVGGL